MAAVSKGCEKAVAAYLPLAMGRFLSSFFNSQRRQDSAALGQTKLGALGRVASLGLRLRDAGLAGFAGVTPAEREEHGSASLKELQPWQSVSVAKCDDMLVGTLL
jgi:hypothetical protein